MGRGSEGGSAAAIAMQAVDGAAGTAVGRSPRSAAHDVGAQPHRPVALVGQGARPPVPPWPCHPLPFLLCPAAAAVAQRAALPMDADTAEPRDLERDLRLAAELGTMLLARTTELQAALDAALAAEQQALAQAAEAQARAAYLDAVQAQLTAAGHAADERATVLQQRCAEVEQRAAQLAYELARAQAAERDAARRSALLEAQLAASTGHADADADAEPQSTPTPSQQLQQPSPQPPPAQHRQQADDAASLATASATSSAAPPAAATDTGAAAEQQAPDQLLVALNAELSARCAALEAQLGSATTQLAEQQAQLQEMQELELELRTLLRDQTEALRTLHDRSNTSGYLGNATVSGLSSAANTSFLHELTLALRPHSICVTDLGQLSDSSTDGPASLNLSGTVPVETDAAVAPAPRTSPPLADEASDRSRPDRAPCDTALSAELIPKSQHQQEQHPRAGRAGYAIGHRDRQRRAGAGETRLLPPRSATTVHRVGPTSSVAAFRKWREQIVRRPRVAEMPATALIERPSATKPESTAGDDDAAGEYAAMEQFLASIRSPLLPRAAPAATRRDAAVQACLADQPHEDVPLTEVYADICALAMGAWLGKVTRSGDVHRRYVMVHGLTRLVLWARTPPSRYADYSLQELKHAHIVALVPSVGAARARDGRPFRGAERGFTLRTPSRDLILLADSWNQYRIWLRALTVSLGDADAATAPSSSLAATALRLSARDSDV